MNNNWKNWMGVLSLCLIGSMAWAQADGDMKRSERVDKLFRAYIDVELDLSEDEGARFWPVYDEYKSDQKAIKSKKRALKKEAKDQPVTNELVLKQIEGNIDIDHQLIDLEGDFLKKVLDAIGPEKTAAFVDGRKKFKKKVLEQMRQDRQGNRR